MDSTFRVTDRELQKLADTAHRDGIAFGLDQNTGDVIIAIHEEELNRIPGLPPSLRETMRFTQMECECVVYAFVLKPTS